MVNNDIDKLDKNEVYIVARDNFLSDWNKFLTDDSIIVKNSYVLFKHSNKYENIIKDNINNRSDWTFKGIFFGSDILKFYEPLDNIRIMNKKECPRFYKKGGFKSE